MRLTALLTTFLFTSLAAMAQSDVSVSVNAKRVATMGNGIINITIGDRGKVTACSYDGQSVMGKNCMFYFSSTEPGCTELFPTRVEIRRQTPDLCEVVYVNDTASIYKEQGWVLRQDDAKLYTWVLMRGTDRTVTLDEARVIWRVSGDFLDGYVNPEQQGMMPSIEQMNAFTDADKIQDATYYLPDGSIYTKYDWAHYVTQDHCHGAMSSDRGAWALQASAEYVCGGPLAQDLTVHMDTKSPVICQYFQSGHFGTSALTLAEGETKLFGPFALYFNKGTREEMIADAQRAAEEEMAAWPYEWFVNDNYPHDRTTVSGRIVLTNYADAADGLHVVLAEPGKDSYAQTNGYCYYTTTDCDGSFSISNVRPGTYALHVYATGGEITDALEVDDISIAEAEQDLGTIEWKPSRYEQLLWRIGEADRLTDGFKLSEQPRGYALFKECPADLDFYIGESNEADDWYYAQDENGTWNIHFRLDSLSATPYHLTTAVAGASRLAMTAIRVNGTQVFAGRLDQNDGSIYRSAVRSGRHSLHTYELQPSLFHIGYNVIALCITKGGNGSGIMWDCIKLETGQPMTTLPPTDGISYPRHSATDTPAYNLQGKVVDTTRGGIYIRHGKKLIIQ